MTYGQTRRAFLTAACGLISTAQDSPVQAAHASTLPAAANSIRWLPFYGVRADETVLKTYDIVVLDPEFQASIGTLAAAGTHVCGYLSLGEIRTSDPLFRFVDGAALLADNPDWQGTRRVDVRHPSWWRLLFEERIPAIASRGFTGLMIDTLDTPPYLELTDPVRYHGMRAAAVGLVAAMRARWPGMMLIMNRGYALLSEVVESIDAVIAESLMTSPDHGTGGFVWVDPRQVELQLSLLKPAVHGPRPLPVLSLDYWYPDDLKTIETIYRRERDLGHHPYVGTRLLDQIVPEVR